MKNIDLQTVIESLGRGVIDFGFKLLAAITIFVVGMWLAKKITKSLQYAMTEKKVEPSLQSFIASFLNIALRVFVVIVVLATLGVQMTSIIAVLGAASLAIGMALSGTLQNVAGGVVILLFKPFRVGDSIQTASGETGVVKKIMIFTTELHTFDNQVVFLPNGALSNGVITNLSHGANRRTDFTVSIAYGDNVDVARKVILDILSQDSRILSKPSKPTVFLSELADSSVVLNVRFWTTYDDMYSVKADVLEKIYDVLPKKKINFPFPQMDVHIVK
ncbi:MAG: mechanosensitive ion channel family protein [Alphaproteobacteria bacterium]